MAGQASQFIAPRSADDAGVRAKEAAGHRKPGCRTDLPNDLQKGEDAYRVLPLQSQKVPKITEFSELFFYIYSSKVGRYFVRNPLIQTLTHITIVFLFYLNANENNEICTFFFTMSELREFTLFVVDHVLDLSPGDICKTCPHKPNEF